MTIPSRVVSIAEQARLDNCAREPIRRPGLIQPHGVLLTADPATWEIVQASDNVQTVIGRSIRDVLGMSLVELLGHSAVRRLGDVLSDCSRTSDPVSVRLAQGFFDMRVHLADGVAVVELEPVQPERFRSVTSVYAALSRLDNRWSRQHLWDEAVRELHSLTGFDRVMIYHFHRDGHGEVVAEQRSDDSMESYLGLHYPASDIPAQARELYLTKISRTIASTEDLSSALAPAANPRTGEPLDLSHAELRSVSPHHTQFMRNMGQAATLSFSLILDGELVGMVTCAHRTLRRLPFALRQALEIYAGQLAQFLGSAAERGRMTRATQRLAIRTRLTEQFGSTDDPAAALLRGPVSMFDLVPARSAAVHHEGHLSTAGDGTNWTQFERFFERFLAEGGRLPLVSEALSHDHPALAELLPDTAGVLIVPVGEDGDYLAWLRPEIKDTIQSLGDQSESNRASPLSPRNSFSAWGASVSGIAESWGELDGEATELGRDIRSAIFRKREIDATREQAQREDERRRERGVAERLRQGMRRVTVELRAAKTPGDMVHLVAKGVANVLDVDAVRIAILAQGDVPPLDVLWSAGSEDARVLDSDADLRGLATALWTEHSAPLVTAAPELDSSTLAGLSGFLESLTGLPDAPSMIVPLGERDLVLGLMVVSTGDVARSWVPIERSLLQSVATDLTHNLLQASLLQAQLETVTRLRQLDEDKNDLIRTVNHELRTPLTSISAYIDLVKDRIEHGNHDDAGVMLDVIQRNATRLQSLIAKMMTAARHDRLSQAVPVDPVDLADLLRSVVQALTPRATVNGVTIDLDATEPVVVLGDRDGLEQVFVNVVENAVKFSAPGGTITIQVAGGRLNREGVPCAELAVRDTGIGIPESELSQIGTKFFRASNARAAAVPGSGLGVSIARRIVEEAGGDINYTSEVGVGTRVLITLPTTDRRTG